MCHHEQHRMDMRDLSDLLFIIIRFQLQKCLRCERVRSEVSDAPISIGFAGERSCSCNPAGHSLHNSFVVDSVPAVDALLCKSNTAGSFPDQASTILIWRLISRSGSVRMLRLRSPSGSLLHTCVLQQTGLCSGSALYDVA